MDRERKIYSLLNNYINNGSYEITGESVSLILSVSSLREDLEIPDSYKYADFKRLLEKLLGCINDNSILTIKLCSERRVMREVDSLELVVFVKGEPISKVLAEIGKFITPR